MSWRRSVSACVSARRQSPRAGRFAAAAAGVSLRSLYLPEAAIPLGELPDERGIVSLWKNSRGGILSVAI